jgi:putative ABC transport system ATP-binding protein
MPAPSVELRQVVKSHRQGAQRVEALRGIDLRIDGPGFFAVMGPSGSGKSTLMHLVGGLDRPDSGEVCVAGQRLDGMSERELTAYRRRGVGIVFQQFNLIGTLDARQNVALPALLDGQPESQARRRADELLEMLGLSARAHHRPDALSGGEQQRVAIARALHFRPPLLLADEPTGNLDSTASRRVWGLLRDLARDQAITVLMVTHEPLAATYCRRVYVLGDGLLRGEFEGEGLDAADVASRCQQLGR